MYFIRIYLSWPDRELRLLFGIFRGLVIVVLSHFFCFFLVITLMSAYDIIYVLYSILYYYTATGDQTRFRSVEM